MRAAIYARRSTDEHQAASLEVQLEEARRFAAAKGWTVDEGHIYREDAVSRAEFKKRPALIAMLIDAKARMFDGVIVRDETRLGGDMLRTGLLISDLLDSGVELHYYFSGERVTLDGGAVDKFVIAARNFASELEREKISSRTREHLMTKARRGYNAGGRVFGYDNVRVDGHVEFRINPEQAAVVREIFRLRASGMGYRAIAIELNARGVPSPRAGKRGTRSWASSQVRSMLRNAKYIGRFTYGRVEKTYKGGTKVRVRKDDASNCKLVTVEVPALAIVTAEVFAQAQPGGSGRRLASKVRRGPKQLQLLTGLAKCGQCGGPMHAVRARFGSHLVRVYRCSHNKERGPTVCANSLTRPADPIEAGLLDWIKINRLQEEVIVAALSEVRRRIRERCEMSSSEIDALTKESAKLEAEIDKLISALGTLDKSAASHVATRLEDRSKRLEHVRARLELLRAAPSVLDLETRRLEREARARLEDFRAMLGRSPSEGRQVVASLLKGPLVFTPVGEKGEGRYDIQGETTLGPLVAIDPGSVLYVPTGI